MEINPQSELAKRLWEYMKNHPTSADAIGKRIGITHTTVLKLLRGSTRIKMQVFLKVENFLESQKDC